MGKEPQALIWYRVAGQPDTELIINPGQTVVITKAGARLYQVSTDIIPEVIVSEYLYLLRMIQFNGKYYLEITDRVLGLENIGDMFIVLYGHNDTWIRHGVLVNPYASYTIIAVMGTDQAQLRSMKDVVLDE
ncbi:MAG: hypothetical protein ACOCXQ_00765 [Patescibacteria group bacterium]